MNIVMSNYHASGVRIDDGHSVRTFIKFKMLTVRKTWEIIRRIKYVRDEPLSTVFFSHVRLTFYKICVGQIIYYV